VENYSDDELTGLSWGGHDPVKVYNAFHAAVQHEGSPTVVLAQTIKGYGLGEAGEARNITHQKKKLDKDSLLYVRDRFKLPISDEDAAKPAFYRLGEDDHAYQYLRERREELGGLLPQRKPKEEALEVPGAEVYGNLLEGTGDREVATTMSIVSLMSELMKDDKIGQRIIPIVPDESRTFGMDALFSHAKIYSSKGQTYEPVDKGSLLYYNESKDGAILEEGITEAGAMGSFIAAGTSHVNYRMDAIPFFLFYSMFGFQRVGDLIWAAADARARGFLIGATSGRSTLPGEGLQHCDGQSHIFALSNPAVKAYDPAYAYEVAVIVRDGLRRMYVEREDIFYYITVMNEKYKMPPLPEGVEEGILNGMYRLKGSKKKEGGETVHLLGSGAILREAIKARDLLEEDYGVSADVWSVTGYKQLYDDANRTERDNFLKAGEDSSASYIERCFPEEGHSYVAATDYLKALPLSVAKWFRGDFIALGTDGFGRSDNRAAMRSFFEVDYRHIAFAALAIQAGKGEVDNEKIKKARKALHIDPGKPFPAAP
jgi:pyruvate dehydrogenase E1 component